MPQSAAGLGESNDAVSTGRARGDGTHVDQAALVAHVEGVGAVAENGARGCAWAGVLAFDGAVDALRARGDGAHVDVCRCRAGGGDALGEVGQGVAFEGAGRAGCGLGGGGCGGRGRRGGAGAGAGRVDCGWGGGGGGGRSSSGVGGGWR